MNFVQITLAVGMGLSTIMSFASEPDESTRYVLAPPGTSVHTLDQNWTDAEAMWFYDAPQGSRLIPYDWFLHLEQPDNEKPFLSVDFIRSLGYIPRGESDGNPDGLPIGFVRDAMYEEGAPSLGMTCAACHTGLIRHKDTTLLVDGAPTMGDIERLLRALTESLKATLSDPERFQRFAKNVLRSQSKVEQALLREAMLSAIREREGYNRRNLPGPNDGPFGPGRVDAFGAILNEVSVKFLGVPENHHAANAPVSYPCLWDTPQHDKVQWNGSAENTVLPLGKFLFGTENVGALGRNTGEVLGVFGNVEIHRTELLPRRYQSTANKPQLIELEETVTTLWSPKWPEGVLGPLDRDRVARGKLVFHREKCADCHASIQRADPNRTVEAVLKDVGTDFQLALNFAREGKTGVLEGRNMILGRELRFGPTAAVGRLLRHVGQRVMLNRIGIEELRAGIRRRPDALASIQPGYATSASIRRGGQIEQARIESVQAKGDSLSINGDPNIEARLVGAEYKARPLNGIWATAPYLHNGSVPTLADLLKPVAKRPKTFHVGGIEYDTERVGFKSDSSYPVFDTSQTGNSNRGHEQGVRLGREEKLDLLEYLKSL